MSWFRKGTSQFSAPSLVLALSLSKACCCSLASFLPAVGGTGGTIGKGHGFRWEHFTANSNEMRKQTLTATIFVTKCTKDSAILSHKCSLQNLTWAQPQHLDCSIQHENSIIQPLPLDWNQHYPTAPSSLEPVLPRLSFHHVYIQKETLFLGRDSLSTIPGNDVMRYKKISRS